MDRKATLALAIALLLAVPLAAGASKAHQAPLVEGHTSYVSILEPGAPEVNLMGNVSCSYEIDHLRLTVPPSFGGGSVTCRAGTTAVAVPLGSPRPAGHPALVTSFHPVVRGPHGATWPVQEVAYLAPNATGEAPSLHLAWTVPVGAPRVDPATGRGYDFVLAVNTQHVHPGERLQLLAFSEPLTG